jgi:arabinose-5-phosphate isomerase
MIINQAKEVLEIEADSILKISKNIDSSFENLVDTIVHSSGRVIISGIGKSGLIGKKITATLISTGTNAIFLHPVEALHGDLGMVNKNDVFLAISNSGETTELIQLLPLIRQMGCPLACFTGNKNSTLAKFCNIVIDTGVEKEACPFNMAPTASTTAQLAMGDALAVVLIKQKKFEKADFIKSHPGGALGKRLSCRVGEIMLPPDEVPRVLSGTPMSAAIAEIDKFKLGAVLIINQDKKLLGIITDGDIRHLIAKGTVDFESQPVDSFMTANPRSLQIDSFLYDALNLMEKYQITVLPVINSDSGLKGFLHLHDILGKGSFRFNGESHAGI